MFNEENDFIFDTPIKWTIIEMILRRNFGKSIKLGSKRRAEKTGEGAGLVSSLFTLFLDLEKNDFDLPDRLLLKVVSDEECAQKAAIIHNTEHFIYKNANLWGFEETAKIPKYFGGADYENKDINAGYFLCEFIEEISFVQYHTNISVNGVAEVVKALARINGYCK
ncbi:unnamed protein product, partial [Mesorhabditis belari]|uniref:Uncharacterized protein n=1 Tax=Mesorhabditis belari TaxID=2138241 RepID=A0AAF3J4Q9_9BILA